MGALSLFFQRNDICISQIPDKIVAVKKELQLMRAKPRQGGELEKFLSDFRKDRTFHNHELNHQRGSRFSIDSESSSCDEEQLVTSAMQSLDKRFGALVDDDVLLASQIFDPLNWEVNNDQYGVGMVATLADKFKDHIPVPQNPDGISSIVTSLAVAEWEDLFHVLQRKKVTLYKEVYDVLLSARKRYPVTAQIIQLTAMLPMSTAECERGFSAMNIVKTKLRNRLETLTLDDLLFIKCNGPSLDDFNCIPAIQSWEEGTPGTRHLKGHASGSGRKASNPNFDFSPFG